QTIAKDLGGSTTTTFWIGTAYILPSASLQPFVCELSHRYGRRPFLLISTSFFAVGSIVGVVARTMPVIIAGRAIQGIGGAGFITLPTVVITDRFPASQRPLYMSLIQIFSALGMAMGPVVGGLISQYAHDGGDGHGGWRWIFYVNFPLCAVGYLAILLTPWPPHSNSRRPVDWVGCVLFTSSLVSLMLGITWGGTLYEWSSVNVLLPLCLGVAGLVCTVGWELWGSATPFLPAEMLRNGSSLALYLGTILQGTSLYCCFYHISSYLEGIRHETPTMAGVGLLAILSTLIPASLTASWVATKTGRLRELMWCGWVVTITATATLCVLTAHSPTGTWVGILLALGVGHGFLLNSQLFLAQATAPASHAAYASCLYTTFRTVGFALGVVVGATVLQNLMARSLRDSGFSAETAKRLADDLGNLQSLAAGAA
ncbi:MFS general substrate transporter, partial [Aspergillus fijiensis CBS 313.89]